MCLYIRSLSLSLLCSARFIFNYNFFIFFLVVILNPGGGNSLSVPDRNVIFFIFFLFSHSIMYLLFFPPVPDHIHHIAVSSLVWFCACDIVPVRVCQLSLICLVGSFQLTAF